MGVPLAAGPGFEFADLYVVGLLFLGLAVFAAIGALSHAHERAFSASLIYLVLGIAAAGAIELLDIAWLDPVDDAKLLERLAELAVTVTLFATGLRLDRELSGRAWVSVARLLGLVLPVTIAAVAAFGAAVMNLPLAAAIVLGAALAPTDPVLAGDIGVGPPGEEDERETSFSITAEAGLNDGLAFPFLILGALVAGESGTRWLPDWVAADLVYGVLVGLAIGVGTGYALAAGAVRLRARELLAPKLDSWLSVPAVLTIFALAEIAGAYGFLAAFAGGIAFRRYEHDHELNARVHAGAEVTEKFSELAVILLLGSLLTFAGLARPGWSGWLLAPLLLLVIRPLAVFGAFAGSQLPVRERAFLAWFGVRGIGSVYYAAAAVGIGTLGAENEVTIFWTIAVCVLISIVVHGVTGSPLSRRLLDHEAGQP